MLTVDLNDNRSEKVHYDYSDYPIYARRALLSMYFDYKAPVHFHDDIEFIAILSGEIDYNINGKIVKIKEGEGLFINARHMHFGFSEKREECDFICVLLHPMLLCTNHAFERDFVLPVIKSADIDYLILKKELFWQNKIFNLICDIYKNKDEKSAPIKVQSTFFEIWNLIYKNMYNENNGEIKKNNDLTIIKNMVGYIQKNYMDKISLSDIAISGAVGQSKCCVLFQKYINQTPNNYLTNYRINKSMELLRLTDMSIIEIALEVGFGGASYYAETFKKLIGQSPTEYRKSKP